MNVPNTLTIDVEDWYHVCGVPQVPVVAPADRRVRQGVEVILRMLGDAGVKATFFVLGSVAEDEPSLVPMIAGEGHEIASHGWSHRLIHQLSAGEFEEEVVRTADILEEQGGKRPAGFRAPQWSLSFEKTPWALPILKQAGYRYDSSMNPLPFIGDSRGQTAPFSINTEAGPLLEIPPLVLQTPVGNLPVGGGWGFRFFPRWMIRGAIRSMNKRGNSAVIYLHPRETDPDSPRLQLSPLKTFATYGPRSDAAGRLRDLLREFTFVPLERLVEQWHSA